MAYRFYILNAAGHINGLELIEADGDDEVRRKAEELRQRLSVAGYEVWDRDRRVAMSAEGAQL